MLIQTWKMVIMKKNSSREDWHRADILAAVRKKCGSLAALSRDHGLSSGTLGNALVRPWTKGEQIIAEAIGFKAEEIWPSRYQYISGEKLKRIHRFRLELGYITSKK